MGAHIFKAAMLTPHRILQPCEHFIKTIRSLQLASYSVTSSSRLLLAREFNRRHLLQNPSSAESLVKTLGASFTTMAKIKVRELLQVLA